MKNLIEPVRLLLSIFITFIFTTTFMVVVSYTFALLLDKDFLDITQSAFFIIMYIIMYVILLITTLMWFFEGE